MAKTVERAAKAAPGVRGRRSSERAPASIERSKTSFRFRPDVDATLESLVEESGNKKIEIVEDAVRLYAALVRELSEGRVIITADEDGSNPHRLIFA